MENREYLKVLSPLRHNGVKFKPGEEFKGKPAEKFQGDQKTVVSLVKLGVLRKETVAEEDKQSAVEGVKTDPLKTLDKMAKAELIAYGKSLDPAFDEKLTNEEMREQIRKLEASKVAQE